MENVKEVHLVLPWNVVDECNGFGLDFGASVCKVIYLHNDDWIEPVKRTKETVSLRCVNFSRTEFNQALVYLKARVYIRRNHPDHKPSVITTGVGGVQYAKEIQHTFNVDTMTITEYECFLAGLNFILRNNKRGEIEHELDKDLIKKGVDKIRDQIKLMAAMSKDSPNWEKDAIDPSSITSPLQTAFEAEKNILDYEDFFPYFVVMIGSAGVIFLVKEDGTYRMAAYMKQAGRTFLGLGSILTKSESYAEIMSKAERGNMRPVHEYLSDLSSTIDDTEESMYGELGKYDDTAVGNTPIFPFGKTVFKHPDQFSSEDVALSFLYSTVTDIVELVHTANRVFPQVKHVFFCGGFPNHSLTRDYIVKEWLERDGFGVSLFKQTELANLHFLKHGSHLGALGAYLHPHLKFTEIPETASKQTNQSACE